MFSEFSSSAWGPVACTLTFLGLTAFIVFSGVKKGIERFSKISMPVLKVTLMDSLATRVNFLKEVCEALGLEDMEFIHSRAEDGGRDKKLRQKYDIATARAVAALPVLCEYCLPFVKKGGIFLAMKGRSEEELGASGKAISTLGGVIEKVENFTLPGTDMERSVIVIRKVKDTPAAYPRQAGKPSKDPIL